MKSRDRQVESGRDHHFIKQRREARDEQPLRPRRNLSPQPIRERSIKIVARDEDRNSLEKREYQRHIIHDRGNHIMSMELGKEPVERKEYERSLFHDRGNHRKSMEQGTESFEKRDYERHLVLDRGDHIRPRSPPPIGQALIKRPHTDGRVSDSSPPPMDSRRKYHDDYSEYVHYADDPYTGLKPGYRYDDHAKIGKDDYDERKLRATARHGTLVQNSLAVEDASVRKMVRSHEEYGITPDYGGSSGGYSTLGICRMKDEGDRYQDMMPPEMRQRDGYYNNEDKYMCHGRDTSYPVSPTFQFKDSGSECLVKGIPSTSSGIILGVDALGNPQDTHPLPSARYSKGYGKFSEPFGSDGYRKIPHFDHTEDNRAAHASSRCLHCDMCNSTGADPEDYFYSHPTVRVSDDPVYSSREFYLKMEGHMAPEVDHRDPSRPTIMDPHAEYFAEAEGYRRFHRDSGLRESDIIRKERIPNYAETRKIMDTSHQDVDYVDPSFVHDGFARRASHNHPFPEFDVLEEHEIPGSRMVHEDVRYDNAGSHMERVKNSADFIDDLEMARLSGRVDRGMVDEYVDFDKSLKRKYRMDEDKSLVNSRTAMPRKGDRGRGDDGRGKWIGTTSGGLHSREHPRHIRDHYLEADEMFEEIYRHKESRSAESSRSYKSGNIYLKGYGKSESSKSYGQPHDVNRKGDLYKQQKTWKRSGKEHDIYLIEPKAGLSDDMHLPHRPVPRDEESINFKQRVHMSFLDFSKRINGNPVARKLYKEQGKAGSLFCIVCGRSSSKEFQNTQSLVTHAYMARKPSMRAQHLGLHKAICVLMGWNSVAPPDVITWAPNVLPEDEAMSLKNDIILWPPIVVVHNISLSNGNHKEWKVVSPEALKAYLRAKGFCRGKLKICLGNPGDQSVMLIKFLGTFSGLEEAERLHNYFVEKKHGRVDFEQALTDIGTSSSVGLGDIEADKIEEYLLFGYMGIADDMDRIDFDAKKRCSVKSKKEIHDIADGPVKRE